MRPIDLAYLSFVRRRSSSLIAVFALGGALGLSGFLMTLQGSISESLASHEPGFDALVGTKSSSLRLLTEGLFFSGRESEIIDYRLFKTINEEVKPELIIPFALFAHYRGVPVIGTDDSFLTFIKKGKSENQKAVGQGRWFNLVTPDPEVVIGSEIARTLDLKPDDWITPYSTVEGSDGKPIWVKKTRVVGILRPSGYPHDRAIYIPITEAWETHMKGHGEGVIHPSKMIRGVSWFSVILDPKKDGQWDLLRNTVQTRSVAQLVEVEREYKNLLGLLGQGTNITWGLIGLSLFLSCSVLTLLMVERFEAMSRDLGLYRALGYSRGQIASALLWESFMFGILGICMGMVLERVTSLTLPWIWNPAWLSPLVWPSTGLLLLWGGSLIAVLLIPWVPIIRLYRWAAHESLSAF